MNTFSNKKKLTFTFFSLMFGSHSVALRGYSWRSDIAPGSVDQMRCQGIEPAFVLGQPHVWQMPYIMLPLWPVEWDISLHF